MWGNACEIDKLVPILKRNIKLIEDASEALGTSILKENLKINLPVQ